MREEEVWGRNMRKFARNRTRKDVIAKRNCCYLEGPRHTRGAKIRIDACSFFSTPRWSWDALKEWIRGYGTYHQASPKMYHLFRCLMMHVGPGYFFIAAIRMTARARRGSMCSCLLVMVKLARQGWQRALSAAYASWLALDLEENHVGTRNSSSWDFQRLLTIVEKKTLPQLSVYWLTDPKFK